MIGYVEIPATYDLDSVTRNPASFWRNTKRLSEKRSSEMVLLDRKLEHVDDVIRDLDEFRQELMRLRESQVRLE